MSDRDVELWGGMLRSTMSIASRALVGPTEVVKLVMKRLGADPASR
jgi:hypothetical protein